MGHVCYGEFSPEFEKSFLEALGLEAKHDPLSPKVVLVGSNFLGLHLKHLLTLETGGHANVRFLTFVDFAERLRFDSFLESGRRLFPRDAEELLLSQLAATLPPDNFFYSVRDRSGFHRALRTTFHDLIDGGVTQLGSGAGRVGEVGRLFAQHRQNYLGKFASTADLILEAGDDVSKFSEIFGTNTLFCYGFYGFTEIQRRLLRSLARKIDIRAWTPMAELDPFWKEIVSESKFLSSSSRPEFHAFSSASIDAEGEDHVRSLLALLQTESIPLHRIAILTKQSDVYSPLFAQLLTRANIPFYREGGRPISETAVGKGVILFLELLGTDGRRTEMIDLLSLLPLKKEFSGMGEPPDWDLWSRKAGVVRGAVEFVSKIERLNGSDKFTHFLRKWFSSMEEVAHSSGWKSFGEKLAQWLQTFLEIDPSVEQIHESILMLSELEGIADPPTLSMMKHVAGRRLRDIGVGDQLFDRNGIFLGSLSSVRSISFDVIAIPGMLDRIFPGISSPDPLLLDRERAQINRECSSGVTLKQEREEEERLLFDVTSAQAFQQIFLSYPRLDGTTGREQIPSSFITHTKVASTASRTLFIDRADWLQHALGERVLKSGMEILFDFAPLARGVHSWVENRLGRPFWTPYDGRVDLSLESIPSRELLSATNIETYATCPYRYFLKYVLHLSTLDAPDDAQSIRPMDRGTLIHAILFRLFSELKAAGLLPLRPNDRGHVIQKLKETSQVAFREAESTLPLGHRLIWETEKSLLEKDLVAFLEMEFQAGGEFVPSHFEVPFGMPGSAQPSTLSSELPVTIDAGEKSYLLRGKIDRIDLTPDGKRARVVDYKSGSVERFKDDRFLGGKSVQLAIYLSALSTLLPGIDLSESEAILWNTSFAAGFERVSFSGKVLNERKEDFHQLLNGAARGVAAGIFPPRPGQKRTHCTFCDFKPVCGTTILSVYERKENDPIGAQLRALEEIE